MSLHSRFFQSLSAGRRPFLPTIPLTLLGLLVFIWTVRIWMPQPFQMIRGGGGGAPPPAPPEPAFKAPVASLAKVDLSDPDALFVGWPLKRVCEEMQPIEGLVYVCDNNSGGIGNIRNYLHTCIRYGLEAGMTGLVLPTIRKRSETDLADLFTENLPFSYMFDVDHFKDAFAENCPRLHVYDAIDQIPGYDEARDKHIQEITPKTMGDRGGCDPRDSNRHTDRWGDISRQWLRDSSKDKWWPSAGKPRLVRFTWGVLFDWPIWKDGPEFAASFGSLLKPHADLMALGRKVEKAMHKLAMQSGTQDGGYLGFHLRSESDALGFWPTYDAQAKGYMEQSRKRPHLKAAYLATGNATEARKLEAQALREAGVKVVGKTDLLEGEDLDALNKLTWDQQGVIDYIVLLGSEFFVGVNPSSFSIIITMRRHLRTGGLNTRPWKVGASEGDGLSFVVGNYEKYWDNWLYMWEGMWP